MIEAPDNYQGIERLTEQNISQHPVASKRHGTKTNQPAPTWCALVHIYYLWVKHFANSSEKVNAKLAGTFFIDKHGVAFVNIHHPAKQFATIWTDALRTGDGKATSALAKMDMVLHDRPRGAIEKSDAPSSLQFRGGPSALLQQGAE